LTSEWLGLDARDDAVRSAAYWLWQCLCTWKADDNELLDINRQWLTAMVTHRNPEFPGDVISELETSYPMGMDNPLGVLALVEHVCPEIAWINFPLPP
jgi:hypothetical protein